MIKSDIKILDCTLRDGGYYTNWDFSCEITKEYFKYIDNLPVEYVEIGYRNKAKDTYFGEYFYLPKSTLKKVKLYTSKKIAIMLNAKDCHQIDLVELLKGIENYVSLIRIATDPNEIDFSIDLAKKIKELGFCVALNIMYISKIDIKHIFFDRLVDINKYIEYLYLVDSYGSIYPDELESFIKAVQAKTTVNLGFHGHNNLELAFANTLRAIDCGVFLIDSTILGMGRGAGNLKTELILTHLGLISNAYIDLNSIGKLTELFSTLESRYKWGTNFAYMVSGSNSLPQKDVMDALEIDRYTLSGIVSQLKVYEENNFPIFESEIENVDYLIIGGGLSIDVHSEAILEFLNKNSKIVLIHSTIKYISLFEKINNTQYFAVGGNSIMEVNKRGRIEKFIFEPLSRKINEDFESNKKFYELNRINFIDRHLDSPLTVSLQITLDAKAKKIYLVGYDGYEELKNKKQLYLMQENQEIINSYLEYNKLISLTKSKYKNLEDKSIYGILC